MGGLSTGVALALTLFLGSRRFRAIAGGALLLMLMALAAALALRAT